VTRLLAAGAVAAVAACAASAQATPRAGSPAIAFVRESQVYTEIWTSDRNGRHLRRVVRLRRKAADQPVWSPSGERIAFSVDPNPPGLEQAAIYVTRRDGSGRRRLTGGRTVNTSPAWSPDESKIAFGKGMHGGIRWLGVFVMRADGTHQHRLTGNRDDDSPAWSPTGRRLVLSRGGSLFIVNANGSGARRLTTPPPPSPSGSEFSDGQPDWSPDGRWIAFVREEQLERGGVIDNLYVIRRDGSGERQLTTGGDDLSPSWSPDGRSIAYASYSSIMAVAPATGRTRMLVHIRGADLSSPAWRR